jgi:pyrimidine-nucleoside phosphorylase
MANPHEQHQKDSHKGHLNSSHTGLKMIASEIIARKKVGNKLSSEEIDYFVQGYSANRLPDYQMAALLMAINLRGMDFEEAAALTHSMLHSGDIIDLSDIPVPKIDKHSTGGVGDKVSLILAPLVAAAGIAVPMISGRGLGHSGGTLDKLEAIPGFRTNLTVEEFHNQIQAIGLAIIGQTARIVPADKKMYSLRDATATVDSVPLITASILSKKLAEGIDGLVLDVKAGNGAFMSKQEDAERLAKSIIRTAQLNGLKTTAFITNMNQPLGFAVGNWLETREVVMALRGHGPKDLMTLTLALASRMLMMAGEQQTEMAYKKLIDLLRTGRAFEKFLEMIKAQGGDSSYILDLSKYTLPKIRQQIRSDQEGFIIEMDALSIGQAAARLGGGRIVMEDRIDYGAGIILNKKSGDHVDRGELLAVLFTDRMGVLKDVSKQVREAFKFGQQPVVRENLIHKIYTSKHK